MKIEHVTLASPLTVGELRQYLERFPSTAQFWVPDRRDEDYLDFYIIPQRDEPEVA